MFKLPVRSRIKKAETLEDMLNAFSPEPLREDELGDFYTDTIATRTGHPTSSPVRKLFKACTQPGGATAHLFLGHMGCGKSTELRKLKQQFEAAGHSVCMIDTSIHTDPFQTDCWSLMMLITEGLCDIARQREIKIPDAALAIIEDILIRDIEVVEVSSSSAALKAEAGAEAKTPSILNNILNLFVTLKGDWKVSEDKRTVVKERMKKKAAEWLRLTNEFFMHIIEQCEGKQPIIIFDGLDRIPQPEKIFSILNFTPLAEMPFPVIYTFPISQCYAPEFATLAMYTTHRLPMIKVKNLDKTDNIEGIEAIEKIVESRARLTLFDTGVLRLLIQKTGGSLRHLFRCINDAAQRAEWRELSKIETEDAALSLAELRMDLTYLISGSDYAHLRTICEGETSKLGIDNLSFLLKMTQASAVLEYANGERWHNVHPLVVDFLENLEKRKAKNANAE